MGMRFGVPQSTRTTGSSTSRLCHTRSCRESGESDQAAGVKAGGCAPAAHDAAPVTSCCCVAPKCLCCVPFVWGLDTTACPLDRNKKKWLWQPANCYGRCDGMGPHLE